MWSKYSSSADKSLARPTSRCILFYGENIVFDASLVLYTYMCVCVCVCVYFSLKVDWSPRIKIEIVLEYNKTNSNICLWNMGFKRNDKKQTNGIWKESIKENLWSYKIKRWYMENQNERWIR
jgi:hypothetical protein